MKQQEHNKPKAPAQNLTAGTPGIHKGDASKEHHARDKSRKDATSIKTATDKDTDACGSDKGSCGTK